MSSDRRPGPRDGPLAGVRPEILARREALVALRRDLHRHPELGFQEERTARVVADRLAAAGIELRAGIARTGLLARVRAGAGAAGAPVGSGVDPTTSVAPTTAAPTTAATTSAAPAPVSPFAAARRTILLRADMDALPLQEETNAPYASTIPGAIHACGHDGHVAILVETAVLAHGGAASLAGDLAFVFQPAEEGLGGAATMIEEGILEETGAEAVFGLHLWSPLPLGKVAVTAGPFMASTDEFEIVVTGKGGHAAFPHTAIDAVVVGSYVVAALQTLVSRHVDPLQAAVVTVGSFHAGSGDNVIAESATVRGTVRTFNAALRDSLVRRLRELTEATCAALGARGEIRFFPGYPATINDTEMAVFVAEIAANTVGRDNVVRDLVMMGAEDMSYFLRERPGCYFFVGAGNESRGIVHPHHSPRFDIDEDSLAIGCELFLRIAERYFASFSSAPERGGGGR
jgi:amidohydrolase